MSSLELLAQKSGFKPTSPSLPPSTPDTRLDTPDSLPVNITPLNPIQFLLRAALICPAKLAIAHPNVKNPVFYSYGVWCVSKAVIRLTVLLELTKSNCHNNIVFYSPRRPALVLHVRAQRAQNLAYALIEQGIGPGDRVVVIAPNCPMIAVRHANMKRRHVAFFIILSVWRKSP